MKNYTVKNGRLYVNGEPVPMSTMWTRSEGPISEELARMILRVERRRALRMLEKECAA
jgi:hypothetical protein